MHRFIANSQQTISKTPGIETKVVIDNLGPASIKITGGRDTNDDGEVVVRTLLEGLLPGQSTTVSAHEIIVNAFADTNSTNPNGVTTGTFKIIS